MTRTRTTTTSAGLRRRLAAAGVAAASLLLFTGCDLFAPQDTLHIKEVADGAEGRVGEVIIANAVLLTEGDDDPASLVTTLVNQSGDPQEVSIHAGSASETVSLESSEVVQLGTSDGQKVEFEGLDATPGALTEVTFQSGDDTTTLRVPVLTGALEQYRDLVPTRTPTPSGTPGSTTTPGSTETPSPTETPRSPGTKPTPSPTPTGP